MKIIFKWLEYIVISIFLILIVSIVFIVNSTDLIKFVADKYAPKYGFSYSQISGSIISGIDVKNLSYRDKQLLELVEFDWNLLSLLDDKIVVSNIDIKGINIDNIKETIDNFSTSSKDDTKESKSDINIPLAIELSTIHLDVNPFKQSGISIDTLAIDIIGVEFLYSKDISIKSFNLNADTNITNINLKGSLSNQEVIVDNLLIDDIDTLALMGMFGGEDNSSASDKSSKSSRNSLIPKRVIINSISTKLKSFDYEMVQINLANLYGKDIYFNIKDKMVNRGEFNLKLDTNLSNLAYDFNITDNKIISSGVISPLESLFTSYKVPIRYGALKPISFNLKADKEIVDINLLLVGNQLLDVNSSEFNINSLNLSNSIKYIIESKNLKVKTKGSLSTPYAKEIIIDNNLTLIDDNLNYQGVVLADKFEGIDKNITNLLKDFKINYSGDKSSIKALIDSSYLQGKFISDDFKSGDFNLSSKDNNISFQEVKFGFNLSVPINFNHIEPLNAKLGISSNIVNLSSNIIYNKDIYLQNLLTIPKKSIIRDIDENLNIDILTPLRANVKVADKIVVNILSQAIKGDIKLDKTTQDLDGTLDIVGSSFYFSGNLDKKIYLKKSIGSIKDIIRQFEKLYKFEAPPINGDVDLELVLKNKRDIELNLSSKEIRFKADRKTEHTFNDTALSLGFSDSILLLNSYKTTFQKQKIFATKPSIIKFKESIVTISPLWVNNELKVTGVYNIKEKSGDILAYANPFSVSHKMIKLKTLIDIDTKLKKSDINIRGNITILGGRLYLDMDKKSFASSSDIIILQNQKTKKSKDKSNIDMLLNIYTKKPLVFKNTNANIKVKPNLVIQQAYSSPLQVLGSVEIADGSYYKFKDKKFVLKKSIIAFTGNPKNPILDISAIYNSINYEITIHITGDPQVPNIIFSSIPRLTREQILSVILFDNENAGDSSSADDMMKMMGGAMAKSALSGMGVKIDHLSLGSDGSMEVGKKISDKVTIIYVNDEVSSARLEYDWTKNIKASISSDGESSGADIVFRKEF